MGVVIYEHADIRVDAGPASAVDGLAVAGERLLAVGPVDDLASAYPRARRVDLRGLPVFPGLVDAHIHLIAFGLGLLQVELRETRSIAAAADALAGAVARGAHRRDGWIHGRGWDKNIWAEARFPTRHDLDPITGPIPAACSSKDGHLLWVNTAALRLAGITRDTPDPPGGALGRDASGDPDGLLKEEATALVRRVIPPVTVRARKEAALVAQAELHRRGVTGVHNFTGSATEGADNFIALQHLHAQGQLTLRVVACVPEQHLEAAAHTGLRTGLGDTMLRVGPLKIFADGTLGSQTASMLDPFEGQPGNVGIQVRTPGEIDRLVGRALEVGLWTAIHAIGDRANRDVLDVFARHLETSRRIGARHRIEHVQVIHPHDLPRLARLGVTASMQAIHATADRDIADRYWGARARYAYAFRALVNSGAGLALGSDAPVETPDPWKGLYAAVARRRHDEPTRPAWYPEERLTLHEAFGAYTIGPSRAAGTERWQGTLEAGKTADFVVLSLDPYAGAPESLLDVEVLATVVGGRIVHAGGLLAGLESHVG